MRKNAGFAAAVCMALAAAGAIVYFSGQTGTESDVLSRGLMETLLETLPLNIPGEQFWFLNVLLRKLAHFGLYFILGSCLAVVLDRQRHLPAATCAVLLCLAFATLDELHQCFSPGRTPSAGDILLDTCGAAAGVLFLSAWRKFRIGRKRRG